MEDRPSHECVVAIAATEHLSRRTATQREYNKKHRVFERARLVARRRLYRDLGDKCSGLTLGAYKRNVD